MFRAPTSGFVRIPFVQRCEIDASGRRAAGLTCNLSVLGLYLNVESPPPVGTELSVRFLLPDGGVPVAASASVTWSNEDPPERITDLPTGCGLRFSAMAPQDRGRIESLVAAFLREPAPAVGLSQPASGRVRIPFVARCSLLTGSGVVGGDICNLSDLGVYVATAATLAIEERLVLSFELPGHPGPFTRRARVAWANPEVPRAPRALPAGYGFEFLDLSEREQGLLAANIAEYLAQLPAARS
jgi:uncharacterized protein (TIGR02266 family)